MATLISDRKCQRLTQFKVFRNPDKRASIWLGRVPRKMTLRELLRRDRLRCVEFVVTGFRRPIRRFRLKDLIAFIDVAVR